MRYPEDSSSRYKGQEAAFQGTVKAVKARLEPELNDDFAKTLGNYQDLVDLRTKVREQLLRQRTAEAENKLTMLPWRQSLPRRTWFTHLRRWRKPYTR